MLKKNIKKMTNIGKIYYKRGFNIGVKLGLIIGIGAGLTISHILIILING